MLYSIDADRGFFRVARRRYYSVLGLRDRTLIIVGYLWVVICGVYLLGAAVGLLPYPRQGVWAAVAIGLILLWPWTLLRMISTRGVSGHCEVFIRDSGLEIQAGKAATLVAWDAIIRGVRLHDGIILLQSGHTYRWLPDGALHNAAPADVVQLLRAHVAFDIRA